MQFRSRLMVGLIATMVILAMAPSSFAQVQVTIFPNPNPSAIQTDRTAKVNDPSTAGSAIVVSGSVLATTDVTSARMVLTFPGPITTGLAAAPLQGGGNVATEETIQITGGSGFFAGGSAATVATINFSAGTLTINLPALGGGAGVGGTQPSVGDSGSFRIEGIRIDVNGLSAPVMTTASLTDVVSGYQLQTTSFSSITALNPGIGSVDVGAATGVDSTGTATIFTNRTRADETASIVITEGFAAAWFEENQLDNADNNSDTQIRLTFSGVPTGVTLALTGTGSDVGVAFTPASVTAAANTTLISLTGNASRTSVDEIQVNITVNPIASSVTLTSGPITVTATMAPVEAALGSTTPALPVAAASFPRFAAAEVGPVTIATIVDANTTLLIPYAVVDLGFDTGIAIANTTMDPFTVGGATAQDGTLVFDFFPRTTTGAGTAFTLTTSSTVTPGVGLDSGGMLPAGGTWTGLLSELLTDAGQAGPFTGYIFIRTNFLLAHGTSFVTDFTSFTSASPVLVLDSPAIDNRAGFEGLSQ